MIAISGIRSRIAEELIAALPDDEAVERFTSAADIPTDADRYLFCAGVLHGESIGMAEPAHVTETLLVNFSAVAAACDLVLLLNRRARICVIGSESGISGSFDMAYAGAKAALHLYVETKRVGPDQQLVGIAPNIIADAGMTTRRPDRAELAARAEAHPKRRWVRSEEVARLAHFLLYEDEGYISGIMIRMNGGAHASR